MDWGCYINIRSILGFGVSKCIISICMVMKCSFRKVVKATNKVNCVNYLSLNLPLLKSTAFGNGGPEFLQTQTVST